MHVFETCYLFTAIEPKLNDIMFLSFKKMPILKSININTIGHVPTGATEQNSERKT